jgi:hypothetical protein
MFWFYAHAPAGGVPVVLYTFPHNLDLEADRLNPRTLALLENKDILIVLKFLIEIEHTVLTPEHASLILFPFIPKSSGGRRPIALVNGTFKALTRMRRSEARRWDSDHMRVFTIGDAGGQTCDFSNWTQALNDEYARVRGLASASVLLDVLRACQAEAAHPRGDVSGFPTAAAQARHE